MTLAATSSVERSVADSLEALRVNPDWAKLPLFDRSKWKRVRFGEVVENLNDTCDRRRRG